MKTTIKLITTAFLATMFVSVIGMAQMNNDGERYINDIPFNTHKIAMETSFDRSLANFVLEEEEYVDDIPFNTELIAQEVCCNTELKQKYPLEEETYVDDIPFNTSEIARQIFSEEESVPMTSNCNRKSISTIL